MVFLEVVNVDINGHGVRREPCPNLLEQLLIREFLEDCLHERRLQHIEGRLIGKVQNFGRLNGRVVAVDYGQSEVDIVLERREYLRNTLRAEREIVEADRAPPEAERQRVH